MFCAFEGPPKIVRFHGRGTVVEPEDARFPGLLALYAPEVGVRSFIVVEVERISDSCGFGVPLLRYDAYRTQLPAWAGKKGDAGLETYRQTKNAASIDGLPALRFGPHEEA
jgi:hypothetical protein